MIRTQVYLTDEQARDIKLRAMQENKHEAEVIRDLLDKGRASSRCASHETTGDASLRLARLGGEASGERSRRSVIADR